MVSEQSIVITHIILSGSAVFKDYLKSWNAKATADKTWNNFKDHFPHGIKEHKSLKVP